MSSSTWAARAALPALLLLPVLAATAACVNTDPAIFVQPSIEAPTLTLTQLALGTSVKGGFDLVLHLGPRASGASSVNLVSLSLLGADQSTEVLSPLPISASTPALPVMVQPGGDETVVFTIDTGTKLLDAATKTALCVATGLVVGGTLQDSLQNTTTPVYSAVFHPSGCM